MGKFYDEIPKDLIPWIERQQMFTVATAPLGADGHVSVSPKGTRDSFHVVDSTKVWYEDLTGSGVETISHLRENGRITILFCAYEGPPRIARLFGQGTVHEFGTPEYEALIPAESRKPGSRSAIVIDVHKVGTSCGYSVPYYDFVSHRDILANWVSRLETFDIGSENGISEKGLKAYWAKTNLASIDGLPGLSTAHMSIAAPNSSFLPSKPERQKGAWLKKEEIKLLLAFLVGALISSMFARLAGGVR